MKKELENKLFQKFKFFDPYKSPQKGLMCFGFECSDGWFNLIWDLCEKIEKTSPSKNFEVLQVKEKFGGLRFYTSSASKKIFDLIRDAETESYCTCELCGNSGKLKHRGIWVKTLCDSCAETNEYNDIENMGSDETL